MSVVDEVSVVVESFIKELHQWEILCNVIGQDKSLSYQEQFDLQKSALIDVFDKYCTKRVRKNGKPNVVSYGYGDSYDYDPSEEIITDVVVVSKVKCLVNTHRKNPLDESFQHTLVRDNDRWLIDTKKIHDDNKDKWVSVSF